MITTAITMMPTHASPMATWSPVVYPTGGLCASNRRFMNKT